MALNRLSRASISWAALNLVALQFAAGSDCILLGGNDRERLTAYVESKYRVPSEAHLRISEAKNREGDCYKKLTFTGSGVLGDFSLQLYLSPDQRFLTSDLLDTTNDPVSEGRIQAKQNMQELMRGEYAASGSSDAPVTVVIFSDFQCPYCKRAAMILGTEPLVRYGKRVRLVFRHSPLAGHDWATRAAIAAGCAQFQSSDAFWTLHDAFFARQDSLTTGNFETELSGMLRNIKDLDQHRFSECLERQMSLGIVVRDKEIARKLGVSGTPTIYVNGIQVTEELNKATVRAALEKALELSSRVTER